MKSILSILLIGTLSLGFANAQEKATFLFGRTSNNSNATEVNEPVVYSDEMGYGFDIENQKEVKIISQKKTGYCTASVPFYFSSKLSEGVYDVNVTLGNATLNSITTIKAEARRLMVYNQKLEAGKTTTLHFVVSVRSPKIDSTRSIRLKSREVNYMNWDNRLSLEFSGENVAVQSISIQPKEKYTTLFLAGNSTVTDQDCAPWASWGQMITRYFNTDVVVANYAESGDALASFKSAGRLDKILSQMQTGDYLFIEFGHNDQKRHGEGIGPWLSFTDLLKEYVTRARENGGIPVLITPTQRRSFNDEGIILPTHGEYPDAMRKVAQDMNVPLIDLNKMTKTVYEAWGDEESKKAFVHYAANTFPNQEKALSDNTHFNTFGAHEVAQCIILGIQQINIPLKENIINFQVYSPEHPNSFNNWELIMSPRFISKKPDGN